MYHSTKPTTTCTKYSIITIYTHQRGPHTQRGKAFPSFFLFETKCIHSSMVKVKRISSSSRCTIGHEKVEMHIAQENLLQFAQTIVEKTYTHTREAHILKEERGLY